MNARFGAARSAGAPVLETTIMSGAMERPTRDFPAFFEHLKSLGFSPATCIDVGAASGTKSIYEAFPEAHHIVFEPLPDFHDALRVTMKGYSNEIHTCALMERAGEENLLRHPHAYGSTLMHRRAEGAENLLKVRVETLDGIIADRPLKGGVLLKTDCQGSDLFVIKGGLNTLSKADVVIMESSFFRFWGPHHPDAYDIISYMKARGFAIYDILDGLFRPHDKALGQVDFVFVKEDGRFRASNQW